MILHDALSKEDPRRREVLLRVYAALAGLGPNPDQALDTTAIAALARTTAGTMTKIYGTPPSRHPKIAIAGRPAARAIAEAKQYSVEPYLRGWHFECRRLHLTNRQRVTALVAVLASWAGHHPGLARLSMTSLPADVESIVDAVFPKDAAAAASLRGLLADVMRAVIVDGITPVTASGDFAVRVARLPFDDGRELDRKAAALVVAVDEFRRAALQQNDTHHPQLAFVLRKAATVLNPKGS